MATSAGILMYRRRAGSVEVLLVHPGGPYWSRKDEGAWSIPKGRREEGEDAEATARREFLEEVGFPVDGALHPLGSVRQSGGKLVEAFAVEGDIDTAVVHSNLFTLEWPHGSGRMRSFPEVDRAGWFSLVIARIKLLNSQAAFIERLEALLASID